MNLQTIIASIIIFSIPVAANSDGLDEKADRILAITPAEAVKEAVANNDFRFLRTPLCVEGMPGFDFAGYRGKRPEPKEIWSSCEELIGEERYKVLLKMEKWVEEYNQLMGEKRK